MRLCSADVAPAMADCDDKARQDVLPSAMVSASPAPTNPATR